MPFSITSHSQYVIKKMRFFIVRFRTVGYLFAYRADSRANAREFFQGLFFQANDLFTARIHPKIKRPEHHPAFSFMQKNRIGKLFF
jgi:hypothetical protein